MSSFCTWETFRASHVDDKFFEASMHSEFNMTNGREPIECNCQVMNSSAMNCNFGEWSLA